MNAFAAWFIAPLTYGRRRRCVRFCRSPRRWLLSCVFPCWVRVVFLICLSFVVDFVERSFDLSVGMCSSSSANVRLNTHAGRSSIISSFIVRPTFDVVRRGVETKQHERTDKHTHTHGRAKMPTSSVAFAVASCSRVHCTDAPERVLL